MREARHKRSHVVLVLLNEMSQIGKSIETESRLVVVRGQGRGGWGVITYWIWGVFLGW